MSRKRSSCFALTINHVSFDRTCLGDYLRSDNLVQEFVCGQEEYSQALDPLTGDPIDGVTSYHHHYFIRFVESYGLDEVGTAPDLRSKSKRRDVRVGQRAHRCMRVPG